MRTVCGSEYQTDGAENRKAHVQKSVLMNGWSSSAMADECEVQLQVHSVICDEDKPEWMCSEFCMSELPACM